MRYRALIERISERTGLGPRQSEHLLSTTVVALARQLHGREVLDLAEELPGPLAADVADAEEVQPRGISTLLDQLASLEPGRLSFTAEHAAVVCETLAESLRPSALHALRTALTDDVASLLAQPRN